MSIALKIALAGFAVDAVMIGILFWIIKSGWMRDDGRVWRRMTKKAQRALGRR